MSDPLSFELTFPKTGIFLEISFFYISKQRLFKSELLPDGATRIFPELQCRRVNRTHVGRVAPDWDLPDAPLTELQCRGKNFIYLQFWY